MRVSIWFKCFLSKLKSLAFFAHVIRSSKIYLSNKDLKKGPCFHFFKVCRWKVLWNLWKGVPMASFRSIWRHLFTYNFSVVNSEQFTKGKPLKIKLNKSSLISGSEINFFRQAPSGDWNFFFSRHLQKCGHQIVILKFFLRSELQIDEKLWSPIFLLRIRTKRTRLGLNGDLSANE